MDKLKAMQTFARIIEEGSLTAAADAMGTSLTSVVRSLSTLETNLGARLLNRSTRRIALTEEGREYLERCKRILSEVEDAENSLLARQTKPAGRLAITAPVMFGRLHVAPVLTDFLADYPELRAELMLLDRTVDMLEEGLDVAFRIGQLRETSLVAIPLGRTRRVVCASPEYLRCQGAPQAMEDLVRQRCIQFTGLTPGSDWEFDVAGHTVKVPVAWTLSSNQVDAALDACLKGLGCGMFLGYQVGGYLADGRLERVLPDCETEALPISMVYPHSRLLSSRVRAFVDWAVPHLRARLEASL